MRYYWYYGIRHYVLHCKYLDLLSNPLSLKIFNNTLANGPFAIILLPTVPTSFSLEARATRWRAVMHRFGASPSKVNWITSHCWTCLKVTASTWRKFDQFWPSWLQSTASLPYCNIAISQDMAKTSEHCTSSHPPVAARTEQLGRRSSAATGGPSCRLMAVRFKKSCGSGTSGHKWKSLASCGRRGVSFRFLEREAEDYQRTVGTVAELQRECVMGSNRFCVLMSKSLYLWCWLVAA